MNAYTLGSPNKIVKGIAEVKYTDPTTGNIMGFDNVIADAAMTTSVNLQEIAGGFGNAIAGVIPDTVRLTGTHTSQAFSFATRQLITGGRSYYNGVSPVCETVVAAGGKLTVSRVPAKHYAQPASDANCWCYVRPVGAATYPGTNYGIDPETKQVIDFAAETGASYEVYYFVANASAHVLEIPDTFNPTYVSIEIKYGVYAKQNNAVTGSTLQGWLYVVIPLAILNGDAGISANQTANATTDGAWMAISPDSAGLSCADCATVGSPLAYYIYVPCGDALTSVEDILVSGGGVTVAVGDSKQLPIKYLMPDDSIAQPVYTDMTYVSAATSTATVSNAGVVTGVEAGNTTVAITLQKADGTTLTATANVTVTE